MKEHIYFELLNVSAFWACLHGGRALPFPLHATSCPYRYRDY